MARLQTLLPGDGVVLFCSFLLLVDLPKKAKRAPLPRFGIRVFLLLDIASPRCLIPCY